MPDEGRSDVLRVAVLVKQVPDPNQLAIDSVTRRPRFDGSAVVNTFDSYAVSEAVALKERDGADITVVTVGPAATRDAVLRGLAVGADRGIHLVVDDLAQRDSLAVARLIAGALGPRHFDLVLAGQVSEDIETGQVGPQVAELLDIPHVSLVTGIERDGARLRIWRDSEGRKQVVSAPLPCLALILSGRDGEQRFPTLRGMMQAKRKPIDEVAVTAYDEPRRLTWSEPVAPVRERSAVIVSGDDPAAAAVLLVDWLQERRLLP